MMTLFTKNFHQAATFVIEADCCRDVVYNVSTADNLVQNEQKLASDKGYQIRCCLRSSFFIESKTSVASVYLYCRLSRELLELKHPFALFIYLEVVLRFPLAGFLGS
ncbi:hypothetical protein ACE1CI_23755 [Aerosakkonemataceae cyanobacterium BLCC-F50]|uniref:Uncharacterized protein n=1 Tax=Floridaenema flaviceps BLCC-F50 TaxID=3153642 RepID=A0ABV4XXZ3_9CYAN